MSLLARCEQPAWRAGHFSEAVLNRLKNRKRKDTKNGLLVPVHAGSEVDCPWDSCTPPARGPTGPAPDPKPGALVTLVRTSYGLKHVETR